MPLFLQVDEAHAGQKLLIFLRRSLENENAELYRWMRSGQVRINSKRAKAETRLEKNDMVRLPPFANVKASCGLCVNVQEESIGQGNATSEIVIIDANGDNKNKGKAETKSEDNSVLCYKQNRQGIIIEKVYENEHLLVINKPFGLACQGGTGQSTDLVKILNHAYAKASFKPAPAHRIDKDTTGLVLIGKTHKALRYLSDFMQEEHAFLDDNGHIKKARKIYEAWLLGDIQKLCEHKKSQEAAYALHYIFYDDKIGRMRALTIEEVVAQKEIYLTKEEKHVFEKIVFARKGLFFAQEDNSLLAELPKQISLSSFYVQQYPESDSHAKIALSSYRFLQEKDGNSLVEVGIFTGRKHQIRVQSAKLGHAVVGDQKYGTKSKLGLKLCAKELYLGENPLCKQEEFKLF